MSPITRVRPEVGAAWDDPSDDLLRELLTELEQGNGTFLVIDWLPDPKGRTFIQAARDESGPYLVEYRDGHKRRHFGTWVPDARAALAVLAGWVSGHDDWRGGYEWDRVKT